jgi:hypothetical protein
MKNFKIMMIALIALAVFSVKAQSKPKPENPYTILERGQHMTKVNIIKNLRGKGNSVQIDANNLTGGTTRLVTKGVAVEENQIGHTEDMPSADIAEIQPLLGNYGVVREVSKFGRGESILLTEAVFPLKLRITISNQILEVLIKEEGNWKISVGMAK